MKPIKDREVLANFSVMNFEADSLTFVAGRAIAVGVIIVSRLQRRS